ncbi:hypothetical protein LCGC14_0752400 [marine sediment metagenome]|uniref:Uncharacterized protein n=1 Tax=marine sediment metagenome TaxID=412755 RepID=A0A0F9Q3J6_9ZZZZ
MTPTDEVLAEFVFKLLKAEKADEAYWVSYYSRQFLETSKAMFEGYNAPFIRHLIEEAMVERRFNCFSEFRDNQWSYTFAFALGDENREPEMNENKTRAVALAAFRTGER